MKSTWFHDNINEPNLFSRVGKFFPEEVMFDFRSKMSGNELVKKESKRRASWEEGIYEMWKLCLRNGKRASVPGIQGRSV